MVLFLKSIWPYRWLILAYLLVIGFAGAYLYTDKQFSEYKLSIAIEESERKDKVIAHQEGVIDLQTAVAEAKHEVEIKYETQISKLYADIRNANATIGSLSQTNNQARNYVTTSTDCPSISEYTTTYIDLYEELGQFAEATSVEADRATTEAVRQHEASRVQVEEYNKFIKEQKGEL